MSAPNRTIGLALMTVIAIAVSACGGVPAGTSASSTSSAAPGDVPAGTAPVSVGPVTIEPPAIDAADDPGLAWARLEAQERARLRTQAGFPTEVGSGWTALSSSTDDAIDAGVRSLAAKLGLDVPIASRDTRLASIAAPGHIDRPAADSVASAMAISMGSMAAGKALGQGGTKEASASESKTKTDGDDVATVKVDMRGTTTSTGSRVVAEFTFALTGDVRNTVTGATGHISGTATAHVEVDGCPDTNGSTKGRMSLSSEESVSGQREGVVGIVGWTRDLSGDFDIAVDDEASISGLVLNTVAQESVQETRKEGDSGAETHGHDLGVKAHFEYTSGPGFTGMTGNEGKTDGGVTNEKNATAADFAPLLGSAVVAISMAAIVLGRASESFWRDGKCVEVIVDPAGGDVTPDSTTSVTAKVRHKFEGNELDKPVVASLTGLTAIEPSGEKVPAPATFTYTAGSKHGDVGEVEFKSVSNRGIGETKVKFTVGGGWTTEGKSSPGTYKGLKCGDVDGVWVIDGGVDAGEVQSKITWTVTIDGTSRAGTYSYKSRTVLTTSLGAIVTTSVGTSGASIVKQEDGTIVMTLDTVSVTSTAVAVGTTVTETLDVPGLTFVWTPGGDCANAPA